jgi:predicted dehydrogenase
MNRTDTLDRRRFLKTSLAATAAATFSIRTGQSAPANEKVNMAFVGIGHRAGQDADSLLKTGLVNPVAFCDVDETQGAKLRKQYPKAPFFQDFRVMFDKMGGQIDAVCVGTPDHTHFPVCMLAASLGKHFYVEKPLTHTFREADLLVAAERKFKVAAQMGNQGHSGDNYYQFEAWTEAGVIKDVTRITAFMNSPRRWHPWKFDAYQSEPQPPTIGWDTGTGPAHEHPYSHYLHPGNWRSWFDYGNGAFGDWGPHILDTAHQFLKLGLPTRIEAVKLDGRRKFIFPMASTIRFSFPARDGMPPCVVTWYDGVDNRPPAPPEMKGMKLPRNGKIIFAKDLVFAGTTHDRPLSIVPKEKAGEMKGKLPSYKTKETHNHFLNFVLACKGEMKCKSPMSVAAPLTQVFLLGVIAQRLGGTLEFDPATKRITNNPQADALLNPPPRKGWEEFHKI